MVNKNSQLKRAIFLDRDGTLNFDPGYLNDASQLRLLDGVVEALGAFQDVGFLLIVVSNQSGVGRGLITQKQLDDIHLELNHQLHENWRKQQRDSVSFSESAPPQILEFACCLHHPDQQCLCRKPKPLLFLEAAKKYEIDLGQSWMIGDRETDLLAGRAAGCGDSLLVLTGDGQQTLKELQQKNADLPPVFPSLLEAARFILLKSSDSSGEKDSC